MFINICCCYVVVFFILDFSWLIKTTHIKLIFFMAKLQLLISKLQIYAISRKLRKSLILQNYFTELFFPSGFYFLVIYRMIIHGPPSIKVLHRIHRLVVKGHKKNDVYSLKTNWLTVDKHPVHWRVSFLPILPGTNWVTIHDIVKHIDGLTLHVAV